MIASWRKKCHHFVEAFWQVTLMLSNWSTQTNKHFWQQITIYLLTFNSFRLECFDNNTNKILHFFWVSLVTEKHRIRVSNLLIFLHFILFQFLTFWWRHHKPHFQRTLLNRFLFKQYPSINYLSKLQLYNYNCKTTTVKLLL